MITSSRHVLGYSLAIVTRTDQPTTISLLYCAVCVDDQ
jgi:hypothetical protein